MKRALLAVALALLFALPSATAARAPDPYPAALLPLAGKWVGEAEAFGASSRDASWYPEAESYLQKAKDAAAAGRVRVASFHVETYEELVLTGRLLDEARAFPSEAERKSHIIAQTNEWHRQADEAWLDYRERLASYDGEIHSLHALEKALYSADLAFSAAVSGRQHADLAREFPKSPGLERGFVLALVRASHTVLLDMRFANDVLDLAAADEGVEPRILDEPWRNLTAAAVVELPPGTLPSYADRLEELARPVRAANESTLSVAIALAEQRLVRANGMETIFGDAQSRGKNIVADAARGMSKQLNNTTVAKAQAHGLQGVFTADAIDRALFAQEFVERGEATIGTVIVAWSGLEHETYATNVLAMVSPVEPVEEEHETPGPAPVLLVGLVALAALALRRR